VHSSDVNRVAVSVTRIAQIAIFIVKMVDAPDKVTAVNLLFKEYVKFKHSIL
jgi:hypothetical protein